MKLRVQIKTRQQWDRYCLWLAVGGGSLAGILWILPALSMALGSSLLAHARRQDFRMQGCLLLFYVIIGLACVPGRRLLWILVAPALWLAWSVTDQAVLGNWPGLIHHLRLNLLIVIVSLAGGCLVALVMKKLWRSYEEEDDDAPDAAAVMRSDSQEGVWPPAPNYPPQPLGRKED
jgi:hypothetical protein